MSLPEGIGKRYIPAAISALIALYSLPFIFLYPIAPTIDGAWERMLNIAIENGQVFGRDFVFTYGPLGFLSTRVGLDVNHAWFYCFDLLVFTGAWYFVFHFVSRYRRWFWYVLICLPFLSLRTSNYSQVLFLLNTIFFCFAIANDYEKSYEGVFCSVLAVTLFYIKINYGLVAIVSLLLISAHAMWRKQHMFSLFTIASGLIIFIAIYLSTNIDPGAYLHNSLELLRNYEAALALPVKYASLGVFAMIIAGGLLIVIGLSYSAGAAKNVTNYYALVGVLALVFVLFLKNGFTRFDYTHWWDFFAAMPLFIMVAVYFLRLSAVPGVTISGITIIIGLFGTFLHDFEGRSVSLDGDVLQSISKVLSLKGYFMPDQEEYGDRLPCNIQPAKRAIIGTASVDIVPFDDVQMAYINNLNYKPRPVLHSYSVYTPHLDSLNAAYFKEPPRRPEFVIMQNFSFDQHYAIWEEPMTKATILLNYTYTDFIDFRSDSIQPFSYLLLRSDKATSHFPVFADLYTKKIAMGASLSFNFPDSDAVYMKLDVGYNAWGSLKAILLKSPKMNITLFTDDGRKLTYPAPLPLIKEPILINKLILNTIDLRNLYTHHLGYCKNITGIQCSTNDAGFSDEINVSFMRLTNYNIGPH